MATEGNELSLQGYTQGIAEDAATWLSTELQNGSFKVPEGYDVKGECTSAAVKLMGMTDRAGKPIMSVVTRESTLMFFKDMATQGLSFSRNQCYAIPYGNELKLQRSYYGTIATLTNMFPNYEISANVIYDGDTYEYCTDSLKGFNFINDHVSHFLNRDNEIIGVYGSIFDRETGERVYGCVMTKKEILKSWSKAKTKAVQEEFPTEMAKRTLINRMCKVFINSKPANVSTVQMEAYQRSLDNEYDNVRPQAERPLPDRGGRKFDRLVAEAKAATPEGFEKAEEIPF